MIYRALSILGFQRLWLWLNRHRLTILTIHGVATYGQDEDWKPLRWQMDKRILREYLTILSKKFTFVSADEAVEMLSGTRPIKKYCALMTIDDGYQSSVSTALPVLKDFGIEPLIFVVSSMCESGDYYWFDEFDITIQQSLTEDFEIAGVGGATANFRKGKRESNVLACKEVLTWLRNEYESDVVRQRKVDDILKELTAGRALSPREPEKELDRWFSTLSLEDVKSLADSGGCVGSHTVSHVRLTGITPERQKSELEGSKRALESVTGKPCDYFCYPEGAVDETARKLVAQAGYKAAFTSDNYLNAVGDDLMALGRFHLPREADSAELTAIASGLNAWLLDVRRRLRLPKKIIQEKLARQKD
jgi:peptidoglycan/xylan/chitin deacetylase (PgdA/CDA1 family)